MSQYLRLILCILLDERKKKEKRKERSYRNSKNLKEYKKKTFENIYNFVMNAQRLDKYTNK